ncbi:MAG: hypothetical protein MR270_04180 [Erysipelotrichaceae bacterium]|nr:hypothetical protein [Erysipelotrichaceae bacterium]
MAITASEDNVHIENSYKILTPWIRYCYSFYLNHFNPNTKNVIKGGTFGVQFEWELHNYAAWVGIGGEPAEHVDLGETIYADGKFHPLIDDHKNITSEGIMSLIMRIVYTRLYYLFDSDCSLWNLITNGGYKNEKNWPIIIYNINTSFNFM